MGIGYGQLSSERLFKLGLKLDTLPRVPFNGAAPAINATLAGDTPILIMGLPPVAPYLNSGKLRALAVTSAKRSPAYPDIPTLDEAGIPGMATELVIGMVAPAKTPAPVIALLQKEVAAILTQPDVKATLAKFSFQPVGSTSEEFASQDQKRYCDLEEGHEGREYPGQLRRWPCFFRPRFDLRGPRCGRINERQGTGRARVDRRLGGADGGEGDRRPADGITRDPVGGRPFAA